jgi:hypothetical protein
MYTSHLRYENALLLYLLPSGSLDLRVMSEVLGVLLNKTWVYRVLG